MCSWVEFPDIGKIEVLRDEKAAFRLGCCPNVRIVMSCQAFLPDIVHIMVQGG